MITTRSHHSFRNWQFLIRASVFLPLLLASILLSPSGLRAADTDLLPGTQYKPQDVVKIVVDALQTNSEDDGDSGIATVYRFASPGNRSSTGPLERFTRMLKGPYSQMLNHLGARYDAMEVTDDVAVQAVWLQTDSGDEVGYAFQLRMQKSGEYEGMWMTDAVVPLGKGAQSGTRI